VTALSELTCCDGFTVEGPDGCLGWVEETWIDPSDHPPAFAVRTPDGRRALLGTASIQAIDADTQEILVHAGTRLRELAPPRVEHDGGEPIATWRPAPGTLTLAAAYPHAPPTAPALVAARASTAHGDRAVAYTILLGLVCLAALVAFEIGLAFTIAYLVTGRFT
jgi:hypothetical protein